MFKGNIYLFIALVWGEQGIIVVSGKALLKKEVLQHILKAMDWSNLLWKFIP